MESEARLLHKQYTGLVLSKRLCTELPFFDCKKMVVPVCIKTEYFGTYIFSRVF
jgi:hypothetical protein